MCPAFIDGYRLASAGITSDDVSHNGLTDPGILQPGKLPHTLRFKDGLAVGHDLHSEPIVLALQTLILIVEADESNVAVPDVKDTVRRAIREFLDRAERIENPHPNEAGVDPVPALKGYQPRMSDKGNCQHNPYSSSGFDNSSAHLLSSYQLIVIFLNRSKSLNILPVPRTTHDKGFSASVTGRPVSSRIRLSRFLMSAPPPASTIPRSAMSAESSGGVRSRTTRMELMMILMHSSSASRISSSETFTLLGTPSIRSRPLISIVRG